MAGRLALDALTMIRGILGIPGIRRSRKTRVILAIRLSPRENRRSRRPNARRFARWSAASRSRWRHARVPRGWRRSERRSHGSRRFRLHGWNPRCSARSTSATTASTRGSHRWRLAVSQRCARPPRRALSLAGGAASRMCDALIHSTHSRVRSTSTRRHSTRQPRPRAAQWSATGSSSWEPSRRHRFVVAPRAPGAMDPRGHSQRPIVQRAAGRPFERAVKGTPTARRAARRASRQFPACQRQWVYSMVSRCCRRVFRHQAARHGSRRHGDQRGARRGCRRPDRRSGLSDREGQSCRGVNQHRSDRRQAMAPPNSRRSRHRPPVFASRIASSWRCRPPQHQPAGRPRSLHARAPNRCWMPGAGCCWGRQLSRDCR